MNVFCLTGMRHKCVEQLSSYSATVCGRVEVNRGFIAAYPHAGVAVGVVERPAQIRAIFIESHETGALIAVQLMQVLHTLVHRGRLGAEVVVCLPDGPVEGVGHRGGIGVRRFTDYHARKTTLAAMSKKKPRPTPVPAEGLSQLIDAHTHLASCRDSDADVVARARAAGVERMVTVGDGLAEAEKALAAAHEFDNVYAACAIHPTKAGELDEATRARLTEMAADPRCVAIGETGLDTYWIHHEPESTAPLEVQEEALRWHAELAAKVGKTLMIHNREADEDLMRVLGECTQTPTVMLHCFSSPLEVAKAALDRGYILSFAGNVTFKRNEEMRQAAALAPAGQLLIETDAPYMTPEPFRGARNEPSLIGHTYRCVAEARGQQVEELAAEVTETFAATFGV